MILLSGHFILQFDYIPGLDAPVRNPFHEAGEDSPASSPVHRSTRKAKSSAPPSSEAAKPNEGPETITVSDDSGDEGKAKRSKGQQEDK